MGLLIKHAVLGHTISGQYGGWSLGVIGYHGHWLWLLPLVQTWTCDWPGISVVGSALV